MVTGRDQALDDEEEPEFYSALGPTSTKSRMEMAGATALQDGSSNLNK